MASFATLNEAFLVTVKSTKSFTNALVGTPNLTPLISEMGRQVHQQKARQHLANIQAAELVRLYRKDGLSYAAIADRLNGMSFRTRRGKPYHAMSAQRLSTRY